MTQPKLTSDAPKNNVYMVEARLKPTKLNKKETRELEEEVEKYLVKRVKECGLDQRKLNPQACKGIPDRLVFDPKGLCNPQFVELKRDFREKASPLQIYLAKGLKTIFIHSKEEVEQLLWQYFTRYFVKSKAQEK